MANLSNASLVLFLILPFELLVWLIAIALTVHRPTAPQPDVLQRHPTAALIVLDCRRSPTGRNAARGLSDRGALIGFVRLPRVGPVAQG